MKIDRERDALLVIDVQNDFMPGGSLAIPEGDSIVPGINSLMEVFDTIVATQDWHPENHTSFSSTRGKRPFDKINLYGHEQILWPDHCIQGSEGADFHFQLNTKPFSLILRKGTDWRVDSYSAFTENWGPNSRRKDTGLMGWLLSRQIRRTYFVGLARDVCVLWSAQDCALALEPRVIWDLTRSVNPINDTETKAKYLESGIKVI